MMDDWSLHDHWDKMWICCYSITLNFWQIIHTVGFILEWKNVLCLQHHLVWKSKKIRDTTQQFITFGRTYRSNMKPFLKRSVHSNRTVSYREVMIENIWNMYWIIWHYTLYYYVFGVQHSKVYSKLSHLFWSIYSRI